jgi:hypothetical protein
MRTTWRAKASRCRIGYKQSCESQRLIEVCNQVVYIFNANR